MPALRQMNNLSCRRLSCAPVGGGTHPLLARSWIVFGPPPGTYGHHFRGNQRQNVILRTSEEVLFIPPEGVRHILSLCRTRRRPRRRVSYLTGLIPSFTAIQLSGYTKRFGSRYPFGIHSGFNPFEYFVIIKSAGRRSPT